jgi:hypothetical protein
MPKYEVKTTAVYTFFVEADSIDDAENWGTDFEAFPWEIEITNVEAKEANA